MPWHTLLYTCFLYLLIVCMAPFWGLWLLLSPKARSGFVQKLGFYPETFTHALKGIDRTQAVVWIHAVSVGEFNAVRPLIARLQAASIQVVVSTTTQTGQNLARAVLEKTNNPVFFCPFDLPGAIKKALLQVKPDMVLIVETELWPNLIDQTTRWWKKPVLIINGRLSERSYKSYRMVQNSLVKPMLKQLHLLLMQGKRDAERIRKLGAPPEKVQLLGNLKFDIGTSKAEPEQENLLRSMFGFHETGKEKILVFASTHPGEDELFAEVFIQLRKTFPEIRMVLAPRHPERCDTVRKLLNNRALRHSLRSDLREGYCNTQPAILLDTIGELKTIFHFSHLAIMGGSFVPIGGHNPLEPIAAGCPVLFGPHMFHFSDISEQILEYKAGVQVSDTTALIDQITGFLTQPEKYSATTENGQHLLENHRGATERLFKLILQELELSKNSALS